MISMVFLNGLYFYTLAMIQISIIIRGLDGKVKRLNQKDGLFMRLFI